MDPKSGRIYRTPEEIEAARARGEELVEITEEQAAIAEEIGEMGNRELRQLPEQLQEGLYRYVLYGIPTGRFLQAVIENDLRESVARMNPASFDGLRAVVLWLYNYAPGPCHGSPEAYASWIRRREERR